ncbi:MAG: hypothetical protein HC908_15455 [Calothrix sp. SM1_7_51]|nr:hypothetical protein [Calothrix sp. SM1_7_51]
MASEICADAASCQQCIDEMSNPNDRRHLYPFTNCTHCGPRLSIVEGIPYDRQNTTMRVFEMCAACRAEYLNPLDRRFHAQPVACHDCGPQLIIHEYQCKPPSRDQRAWTAQQIEHIAAALRAGQIVAIKGLGGFHLSCDASNEEAVSRLRQRKQRYAKPLALMGQVLPAFAVTAKCQRWRNSNYAQRPPPSYY